MSLETQSRTKQATGETQNSVAVVLNLASRASKEAGRVKGTDPERAQRLKDDAAAIRARVMDVLVSESEAA